MEEEKGCPEEKKADQKEMPEQTLLKYLIDILNPMGYRVKKYEELPPAVGKYFTPADIVLHISFDMKLKEPRS